MTVVAAVALVLPGCATASAPEAVGSRLTVRVAPRADLGAVEVQLAQPHGGYRAVHRMRSGQTRSFAVPAGWVTVRVPGLCVVPTPTDAAPATVEIGRRDCSIV